MSQKRTTTLALLVYKLSALDIFTVGVSISFLNRMLIFARRIICPWHVVGQRIFSSRYFGRLCPYGVYITPEVRAEAAYIRNRGLRIPEGCRKTT